MRTISDFADMLIWADVLIWVVWLMICEDATVHDNKIAALQIENTNFIDIPLKEFPAICIGKDQQDPLVVVLQLQIIFIQLKRVRKPIFVKN